MNEGGTKRERRDRASGLIFAWRVGDTFHIATWASVLIVVLLAVVLLGTVKVRVVPPPRIIERKASEVLIPQTVEGRAWIVRAEEEGPFPARFRPAESAVVQALDADLFQAPVSGTAYAYKSGLRELPKDDLPTGMQVAARGERVFPPQAPLELLPKETAPAPLVPMLSFLSRLPADARPAELPAFHAEVSPEMAAATWQFMVEVGEKGRALRCISMDGGKPEGELDDFSRLLGSWLCQVHFGSGATKAGWIAVEINFSRQP